MQNKKINPTGNKPVLIFKDCSPTGYLGRCSHIKKQIMTESLLIINGATRINGNTDILVEKIIDGAKNMGLNLVELKSKNI